MRQNILFAIGLILLGLEHLGVPIPGWLTGIILLIVGIVLLLG